MPGTQNPSVRPDVGSAKFRGFTVRSGQGCFLRPPGVPVRVGASTALDLEKRGAWGAKLLPTGPRCGDLSQRPRAGRPLPGERVSAGREPFKVNPLKTGPVTQQA